MATETLHNLTWLARWYGAQCDGDWEHSYGVAIETLDNPGWALKIDLSDTPLESAPFEAVARNLDAQDGDPAVRWYTCRVTDRRFEAAGGVQDLEALVGIFRHWAE